MENTVLVFGSDNGYFLGAHQRGDKRLMYEESLRIPLIIRYPEMIEAGIKNSELVLNIDIAPTLIELAGAKVPGEMQGVSFVPLLKNEVVDWRKSFLYEYFQDSSNRKIFRLIENNICDQHTSGVVRVFTYRYKNKDKSKKVTME